jgi:MazG family protein
MPFTLEEVYEIADTIERGDMDGLRDELGDLLFHIIFYAQIASEQKAFSFRELAAAINMKLRNRHPHVFAGDSINSLAEQVHTWEKIKHQERKMQNQHASLLDAINQAQPAMSRAITLQKRAATVGFDWPGPLPVLEKLEEEIRELRLAIESAQSRNAVTAEIGDVIFSCVNLARHMEVNPEVAVRQTNRKFEQRFRYVEQKLAAVNKELSEATLAEMESLWQEAKLHETE